MKEITLKGGELAKVDDEDFERVNIHNWQICNGYAIKRRKRKPRQLKMARFILNYDGPLQVDHINGDKLDNRKQNLRIVTPLENANNKHTFRKPGVGVTYNKRCGLWLAYVWTNKKQIGIGYAKTKEEAIAKRAAWIEKNGLVLVGPVSAIQKKT